MIFLKSMKAKIITYETKQMTNSQKSIISKRLFGYTDRTKGSKYKYKRKGILEGIQNIIITKKTFIENQRCEKDRIFDKRIRR